MAQTLAVKYRPKTFEEVLGQSTTTKLLKNALDKGVLANCILLSGSSGCGKTTCAKIIANELNNNVGEPIEIDAASNNGVDQVRAILESAKQRSLSSMYKVFILDECHMLTLAAWNALLKFIEEASGYCYLILCTTDPQKIPETVLNRVIRYSIAPISTTDISNRLMYICEKEGFTNYEVTCDYISKIANGCMRDAITLLQQVSDYSTELSLDNAKLVLGDMSVETMIYLTNALIDANENKIISIVEELAMKGHDLKRFIDSYLTFVLDLSKYIIFNDIAVTSIPAYLEAIEDNELNIKYTTTGEGALRWFNQLADRILELKLMIKYDTAYKATIEVFLLRLCRR